MTMLMNTEYNVYLSIIIILLLSCCGLSKKLYNVHVTFWWVILYFDLNARTINLLYSVTIIIVTLYSFQCHTLKKDRGDKLILIKCTIYVNMIYRSTINPQPTIIVRSWRFLNIQSLPCTCHPFVGERIGVNSHFVAVIDTDIRCQ